MGSRFVITVAFCLCMASAAAAQVVRFETSVGDFDMVLNPTHNSLLQGQVDNMLNYVRENRYEASWINRAPANFVLQMGSFYSNTARPSPTIDSVRPIFTFDPVQGHPGIPGLSNTVGTVSLALPGDGNGGTDQNGGTSSFFVNLTDNSFLDPNFTVFAAIPDMTVVNKIMGLSTINRTPPTDPVFGAQKGDPTFTDVPLQDNGFLVFIKSATILSDTLLIAQATADVQSVVSMSQAAAAAGEELPVSPAPLISGGTISSSSPGLFEATVPEPNSLLLAALGALCGWKAIARRRRGA